MILIRTLIPVLVLLASLVGCADLGSQRSGGLADLSARISGIDWIAEARLVLDMSATEQTFALDARRQAFRADPGPTQRMRLVLMRALGGEGVRNEAAALALIEGFDMETLNEDVRTLAMLLGEPLRENARNVSLLGAERKLLVDKDQRIGELEKQLEAFTSIEQSIKERQKAHQGVKP